jgi:antibiotic biosynthesis monooxygenase (ABM) superfamily enzyme
MRPARHWPATAAGSCPIPTKVLTLTATVLVIWVAEPSVRRALRDWLHAPNEGTAAEDTVASAGAIAFRPPAGPFHPG